THLGTGQTRELELGPRFNDPGAYDGRFIPTAAGDYRFHITGTIDGVEIDEEFTSGPGTFSAIIDTTELQFPEQVPSNQEIVARLEESDDGDSDSTLPLVLSIVAIGIAVSGLAIGRMTATRK